MKRLIIAFVAMYLLGCREEATDHPVFKYFPDEELLDDGYVSKYYYHFYPDNPDQNAATKIVYAKYKKLDDSHFIQEAYNAAFDLEQSRLFKVEGDSMLLLQEKRVNSYAVADTSDMDILSNTFEVWDGDMEKPFEIMYTFDEGDFIYVRSQISVSDTLVNEKNAKVFAANWSYKKLSNDSIYSSGTSKSYYVKGLGFYGSITKGSTYTEESELVEQMPISEFVQRSNHGEHRVAWIDPENTISDDSGFTICGHERNIADYYNSTPDGRYLHNKRAMLDTIDSNLDKSKLFNQSGRLVFRFVVNCEGKAGRFVAEGYDMDYRPMDFEQETITHLFEILKKLADWRPVVVREEARDAYFYITFNITDGEITDILP